MIRRSKTFFLISLLLIFIVLSILILILLHKNQKRNNVESTPNLKAVVPTSDDDPIPSSNEPMYDDNAYTFPKLFANQFPLHYVDSFGITHTPTGNNQTIAIVSNVLSIWSAENIVLALEQCGITNKTAADIVLSQIIQIDATTIEDTFDYLHYRDLTVPLSDGFNHQVEYDDVRTHSNLLEVALQCLFTALPDIKVVIFYYGTNICPPDEDAAMDLYDLTIRELFNVMESVPIFKIFCNNLIIDDHSGDLVDFVRGKIMNMTNKKIQVITTMGESDYEQGDVQEQETIPPAFSKIIRVGGLLRLFNSLPTVYEKSNGGYFTLEDMDYERSTIPYGQVGYVTPTLPTSPAHDPDLQFVGCPDAAGFCAKLSVFFGTSTYSNPSVRDISIPAYAYAVMIAMVNEISNETAWNYQRFFYRYHFFLFDYVNSGTNNLFKASDYRIWNPCSGLGQLNGNKLAALLSNKYILTGYPIQLTSLNITELMCYVNFYPVPPLTDPNNVPSDGGDYIHSQPAFGPQSIWSELFIYVVSQDPQTGNMMIPRNYSNQIVRNRDTIVIVSSQSYSTAWALAYVNEHLQITTHNIRPGVPIPPEFLWTIDSASGITEQYIRITGAIRLSPYLSNRRVYLTSEYRAHRCPSISPQNNDVHTVFTFLPHVYHLIKSDYNDTTTPSDTGIQKSYFINLTNKDDFITCGFTIEQSLIMGRDLSSGVEPPYVQFTRNFDAIPQWLLIPAHSIHNSSDMNTGLTFGRYMIFNTRCQAYLYLHENRYERTVKLININERSAPISKDIYNWAVFNIRSSNVEDSDRIFKPRGLSIYPYNRINDFLSRVIITFDAPYYSNSSPFFYRLYLSSIPQTINEGRGDIKILQFVLTEPPANIYMFLIQNDLISTTLQDVYMKPAFVTDFNRRFSNCVISAGNPNDYVAMMPYNTRDPKQKWECLATPPVNTITDTFQGFVKYPIIRFDDDDSAGFQFQNYQYRDMFLIHCENGWKPRLGYPCDDGMNWVFYANYFNAVPGNSEIKLSGNYLYLNTVYFVSCRRGVLTSSINVEHLPALLTQISRENNDTEYYGSSFIIFKN